MQPIIGIIVNIESRAFLQNQRADYQYLNAAYSQAIEQAGGIPVLLPLGNRVTIEAYAHMLDGLILAGGDDIHPHLYGHPQFAQTKTTLVEKDEQEILLMQLMQQQNKPVFGICRGMQLLNIAFGGTLWQDISFLGFESQAHLHPEPFVAQHLALTTPGTIMAELFGEVSAINSLHHQTLRKIAPNFQVSAHGEDGLVEAIEDRMRGLLGVQWHPELLAINGNQQMQTLFTYFVQTMCHKTKNDSPVGD